MVVLRSREGNLFRQHWEAIPFGNNYHFDAAINSGLPIRVVFRNNGAARGRSSHTCSAEARMRSRIKAFLAVLGVFVALGALHYPLLRLPYFWDEAGYYIPAAWDFYRSGLLVPHSTLPTGHSPLVIVYLGFVWGLWGFSALASRTAMVLVASATVVSLYALGRRVGDPKKNRELAGWSALLLALSPLFFAQSSLAHLDLAAGLFTTLAILSLLGRRVTSFTLAASLAVLSKETAVVLLPVAWTFAWRKRQELRARAWIGLVAPLLPLLAWAAYYRHSTGYWTGNREYLEYNFFSTLDPGRFVWSLLRRLYEVFIGGFNWLLVVGSIVGIRWGQSCGWAREWKTVGRNQKAEGRPEKQHNMDSDFHFLAGGLCAVYVLMLSLLGGAVLPRYLLPIFPVFYLLMSGFVWRLPKAFARGICMTAMGCFVGAWCINPSYPFPFDDNLSYADFVRLHQQTAQFLEALPEDARILTAWPASDELERPFLGYVRRPLRVVPVLGFTTDDFLGVPADSFDLLYLYSRKWEPRNNWLARFPEFQRTQRRYFDYAPQVQEGSLWARYRLKLLRSFERRGQWVRIYKK